jgi:hypothetical protein
VSHWSHQSPQSHFATLTMEVCSAATCARTGVLPSFGAVDPQAPRGQGCFERPQAGRSHRPLAGKAPLGGRLRGYMAMCFYRLRRFRAEITATLERAGVRGSERRPITGWSRAQAVCGYEQSRNVLCFHAYDARWYSFDQGFRLWKVERVRLYWPALQGVHRANA